MSDIQNISLFIPHVFPNFTKEYVAQAFNQYGDVEHIDFVAKQDRNGKDFNSVYVHFNKWYDTEKNRKFQANLLNKNVENENRVYHDSTWYWIVLPNTAKKHVSGDRKPRIDLDGVQSISINERQHFVTPEKSKFQPVCPDAPVKSKKYAEAVGTIARPKSIWTERQRKFMDEMKEIDSIPVPLSFENNLEKIQPLNLNIYEMAEMDEEMAEMEAQMYEIEAELEAEDANLVTIDYRYIKEIEQENMWLTNELAQLRAAIINLDYMYKAEVAKVSSLSFMAENMKNN